MRLRYIPLHITCVLFFVSFDAFDFSHAADSNKTTFLVVFFVQINCFVFGRRVPLMRYISLFKSETKCQLIQMSYQRRSVESSFSVNNRWIIQNICSVIFFMWWLPAKEKKTVRIIVVNFIRQMLIPARFPIFMLNISLQIAEASAYLEIFVTVTKFLIAQFRKNLHQLYISFKSVCRQECARALPIPVMTLHCVLKALFMNSLLHPLTGNAGRRQLIPPCNRFLCPWVS